MLIKKSNRGTARPTDALSGALQGRSAPQRLDRRTFLKRSGFAAGVGAVGASLPLAMVKPADAAAEAGAGTIEVKRSICTRNNFV